MVKKEIQFISEKKSKFLTTRLYRGYNQELKISDDGFEKNIMVTPDDPTFGVTIKYLEFGKPYLTFPEVPIDKVDILLKNVEKAKSFCSEFFERKEEFGLTF